MSEEEEKVPRDRLPEKKRKWVKVEMEHQTPEERAKNFEEVMKGFTKEQALEEATRCMGCKKLPCVNDCPIKQDILGYMTAIKEGNYKEAMRVILDKNPFPASVGRVCPQFCTAHCTRGKKGDPLCVAGLKRAASDFADATLEKGPPTGKRIAIIGGGPAGLGAGFDLVRWGHEVVVFERENVKGGMLHTAIPSYRLPREEIERDVSRIEKMGVVIKTGVTVGKDVTLDKLKEEYDAVLIAVGTHKPKYLGIEGEDKKGVIHVIQFLKGLSLNEDMDIGEKVAIIGGGSSAMDAVRSAKRLNRKAYLVYRRAREQMPAQKEEVDEGVEEGIDLKYLTNPTKIEGGDKVEGMEVIKMELGPPDASGRARPIPIEGSEFKIDIDMVVEAISQEPDLEGLDEDKFKLTRWNTFAVDEDGMTSVEGIFAGGDCVNGPSTIVEALASVRTAAIGIHRFLMGVLPPGYEKKEEEPETTK